MNLHDLRVEQSKGGFDKLSSLRSVQINPIDICNRKCAFCPRSDPEIYTSRNWVISERTTQKLADDLNDINFNGRVGFVGFGEPLLHKKLTRHIEILAQTNSQWIDINTNGDYLTANKISEFADAGCTHIMVSMYDKDITNELIEMKGDTNIEIIPRHCYPERFELNLIDRKNNITADKIENITNVCHIPFYKMFIDWNGDALICDNDWGRKGVLGNIHVTSVKDIWFGDEIMSYRKKLLKGLRAEKSPCNTCNIKGTVHGKESFDTWKL